MITRKGQKESAIVCLRDGNWERNETSLRIAGRTCSSQSVVQPTFPPLPSPPSNTQHPTTHPTIPSIISRRMSFFSRKKNVSRLHALPFTTFVSSSFFFLHLFSSFHTGEAPDTGGAPGHTTHSRYRHVSPVALSSAFTAALTAYLPSHATIS